MVSYNDPELHRCRYTNKYPQLGVYGGPMSFVVDAFRHITTCAWPYDEFKSLLDRLGNDIEPQQRTYEVLKYLSDKAEEMEDENPTIPMLLIGLERCTPPRTTDRDAIITDMKQWVSG
ncbi:unnamed protein product [Heligmosomoides polygyrus]|uniref:PK_Tyr_Ser-Thr domain-containing protein n=1 Tax=Heligmosomoides polygyrus TaxID=6339 RepID=A0A183GTH8_HELPZ|nr:unnamed protein product [Heligmosomoides polygyrus]